MATPTPTRPPRPTVFSRARPPRLIYPVRRGDYADGSLFTFRVRVDRDGHVVGARLHAGPTKPHENDALTQIWRFLYEPALDEVGRPTASWIEQSFIVRR